MVKVLIADKLSDRAAEIFRERGIEADEKPGLSPEEQREIIGEYDGLAVRSATKVTPALLEHADRLRVIGRAGIGVDNIDIPAATKRGICVMNTPYGNSITTAEHAVAMMMSLARQIPQADASTQAGKWEKSRFMGVELFGKTLGVIGCGNIGSIVADRAQGLKMRVVAFDPYLTEDRAVNLGVEKVTLDELLARADFISLHTPMTDQTKGIIDAAAIAKCKEGVRIINCARGGLVVEEDLKAALDSGRVAGAAMDVFVKEPAKENILFGHPNLVATPHLGASTSEAQENVALQVAEQMADYLVLGAVTNAINMPSVTAEEAPRLRPYMKLAEQLGSLAAQMANGGLSSIQVEYEGHAAELNTRPLTAIVLQGVLQPKMDSVNMVNAPVVAKERDIDVAEVKNERQSFYQSLMRVVLKTDTETYTVTGPLFGRKPRIVEIDSIQIEAELEGHMLYVENDDKPGFIGNLGTALGKAGVNIATFALGRSTKGAGALSLIAVDEAVPEALLKDLHRLDGVRRVTALNFGTDSPAAG